MHELEIIQKSFKQAVLIASAIIAGCGLMIVVLMLIPGVHQQDAAAIDKLGALRLIAWAGGIAGFFLSILMKRQILTVNGPLDNQQAINRLNNSVLMPLALCEGPILFGSVVYYLSKDPVDLVMPFLVGVVGFSMHFPRFEEWDGWIKSNKRQAEVI